MMAATLSREKIDEINLEYLPRLSVRNAEELLEKSAERSARVRKKLGGRIDLPYGKTPGQRLDVFPSAAKHSPVQVFIHGGYWRALDKRFYSHLAAPLVAAGATAVLINYDLCPAVRITDIVRQVRHAIVWVYRHAAQHNGDRDRIYVSGHSAGGHLAGMLIATDWAREFGLPNDLIKGTVCISGLFDIRPHRHSQLQPDIRLSTKEATAMSPMLLAPIARGASILAVGALESNLFHWQSLQYAAHLRLHGVRAEYLSTPGDNHFTITDRLEDGGDPLTRALIAQMGLSPS